jgi:signal transduction histidine kinase
VLHNVGNVLNSVNVSATLVAERVQHSKAGNASKVSALLREHEANLATYLTSDPRGRHLPGYLQTLAEQLSAEHQDILRELNSLRKNIDHIKDIVAAQQSYAKTFYVTETLLLVDLVEEAVQLNSASFSRHDIALVRDYRVNPTITIEKHQLLQILVNLLRNAMNACDDCGPADKTITVKIFGKDDRIGISVTDNGVGISPENLKRIFEHGFTTRKEGHGFGLHSGALAAKALGGTLRVSSDGLGRGATFALELPASPPQPEQSE